jgi:hypothetical protein
LLAAIPTDDTDRHEIFHAAVADGLVGILQSPGRPGRSGFGPQGGACRKHAGLRRRQVFRVFGGDAGDALGPGQRVLNRAGGEIGRARAAAALPEGDGHRQRPPTRIDVLHDLVVGEPRRAGVLIVERDGRVVPG